MEVMGTMFISVTAGTQEPTTYMTKTGTQTYWKYSILLDATPSNFI